MGLDGPIYGKQETWTAGNHASSRVVVTASHAWWEWVYMFFKVTITINGERHNLPWGTHSFDLLPGHYEVSVSYPWLFQKECGKNTVKFDLPAGSVKSVRYRAGMIRYIPGKISVE